MALKRRSVALLPAVLLLLAGVSCVANAHAEAQTALQLRQLLIKQDPAPGPPKTVPFDTALSPISPSLDLDSEPLRRKVTGFLPEQIKVTYWGEGQVVIGWATGAERMAALSQPPPEPYDPDSVSSLVQYWVAGEGAQPLSASGSHRVVYNVSYAEDLGGTAYQSPILHHVLLTGLAPGQTYTYKCGCQRNGWSEEHTFKLPASPSALDSLPFRIALIGDLGQSANSTATLEHLRANIPDLLILPGDLSYADQHLSNGSANVDFVYSADARRWDSWGRMMELIIAGIPHLSTVGNHELEIEADGRAQVAFNARYPMPQNPAQIDTEPLNMAGWLSFVADTPPPVPPPTLEASFAAHNSYYSVDLPGCHLITLSSYHPYGETSQQYKWFQDDIAAVDRSVTPWLIVVMHAPFYSSYAQLWKQNEFMRSIYEPLFYRHGVDLVLNGHMHAYERTFPVYNNSLDDCGPAHITIGNGGNEEGVQRASIEDQPQPGFCANQTEFPDWFYAQQNTPTGEPLLTYQDGKYCPTAQPAWSALRDPSFGHGILELTNATHASWRWFRNQDSVAEVGDAVTYIRSEARSCRLTAQER